MIEDFVKQKPDGSLQYKYSLLIIPDYENCTSKCTKNRPPSMDFCHFWRYNENTCELNYFFM